MHFSIIIFFSWASKFHIAGDKMLDFSPHNFLVYCPWLSVCGVIDFRKICYIENMNENDNMYIQWTQYIIVWYISLKWNALVDLWLHDFSEIYLLPFKIICNKPLCICKLYIQFHLFILVKEIIPYL